ncbi:hypothetical protein J3R80_08115 [Aliiroseovarius sp. Z3]|uniref:hypothetical protein n=1 Tax=Aliiroseovarius sp. Z3 TaxID=2811402 RepID=UPI0023B21D09|nr:hypothetical protein [Aliiroseovarius sp. Z3]MDE9450430.1 hypothetical protein [Aliiroseovarius sp. Z3]
MTDSNTLQSWNHPDSHELNDWHLFGPKNSEVADLVLRLAYEKGMRLADIEQLMVKALSERLFRDD